MRTTILAGAAIAVLATALPAAARDLTIVGWGGAGQAAQDEVYFTPFSEKVGKPFIQESWDGGYGVLQAKLKAGAPNWDVVQVEAEELALGCADGLYETLDWDKIGVKDEFLEDAVSECGAGVIYWSMAMGYDGSKIADGPKNWADFWDTAKYPGKRSLRKGAKYNLEFALLADGVTADELYDVLSTPEGVDRAFKKLDELKPNIVWWESGAQPVQFLASGEVALTSVYNGRITGINKTEGKDFRLVWPESMYAVDSWVILKGAENKDLALDFIAFASQAENQAKLPLKVDYGVPNKKAAAAIPEDVQKNLPTYPENLEHALPLNVDFWIDNSEALTERFNAWLAQ
ncbi:ABC transporter substrate-binding protein [Rhizobiaceae bacterium BDR2-2]|uniref:ABC transporter substrate-binding protein n=2 Tax=Ectorhizobium quercum TaxID=2965071 RepID=A0AAE3MUV2_9HYPH|nr:ABC transporter substrate-binding protein [Ectorhizobium quercum]MCX8995583.1 ABC transporter substrate-binding protein [Ectorhizobium quercum]